MRDNTDFKNTNFTTIFGSFTTFVTKSRFFGAFNKIFTRLVQIKLFELNFNLFSCPKSPPLHLL